MENWTRNRKNVTLQWIVHSKNVKTNKTITIKLGGPENENDHTKHKAS